MATNSGPSFVVTSAGATTRQVAVPTQIQVPSGHQVVFDFFYGTSIGSHANTTHLLLRYSDALNTNAKIMTAPGASGQTNSLAITFPGGFRTTGLTTVAFGCADNTAGFVTPATTILYLIVGYHFEA